MAGLVSYASSDDEGYERQMAEVPSDAAEASARPELSQPRAKSAAQASEAASPSEPEQHAPPPMVGPVPQSAVPLGPFLPAMESSPMPLSPHSANRALVHDLTLPSIPDLDIPPSPPGSPPTRASKNFEQFLALKKKGTHFNSKLEQSKALRNPRVMDKLMEFVGLDGPKQYETTLSPDLWNPRAFPDTAFADRLRKSREKIVREREADKPNGGRVSVEFVPSATTTAGTASRAGGLAKGDKRKGDWN